MQLVTYKKNYFCLQQIYQPSSQSNNQLIKSNLACVVTLFESGR